VTSISIITPNYNYGHFLEQTLQSVLCQRYPMLEYIVMDDGSTDNSVEIIKRYADRLAHWETGPNRGQYAVITEGFRKSTGEVMGWLNSDDMHLPYTLKAVAEIFEAFPEVEWITTMQPAFWDYKGMLLGCGHIDGFSKESFLDGRNFSPLTNRPVDIGKGIKLQGCLQQESTFWRRALWEKAGAYLSQDYGSAGDFELWCRFLRYAEPCGVATPLSGFRLQNQQQTAQRQSYADGCLKALRQARRDLGYKPNAMRSEAFRRNLTRPARLFARYDYEGTRIVRANIDGPEASWRRERHRFR
jgi:glycosyltransferase involved in cell wall biosynthesis